ncbi:MAG: hypothetical protein AUI14_18680 [Actinobacteria bacterium 13_2_20CM_2_71_6]|nr:MAG: hypothetical protein AUI14_18680 [Actinobacteria bacterium 13_2_20CM_2_71_6]
MRGWWRTARIKLRRRVRRLIGVLVLLVLSTLLLVWARLSTGFNSDLLLNVGASVVIVALSYAIFDPLFEELRRSRVEEHAMFDHDEFSRYVSGATDLVAVMDTGNHILEGSSRSPFLSALRMALRNGAKVRVLLLDPDSAAASQRAEEIRPVDVRRVIVENLRHLNDFADSLDDRLRSNFQVRIYDASPSIQIFRWDDKALISFFPIGVRASASPHLEVYLSSPLGEFVQGRFDDLWRHPSTRELTDYVVLPVTVYHEDVPLRSCAVHFVRMEEACFIDGAPMVDQLTDHGTGQLDLVTGYPLQLDGCTASTFRLARVDSDTVPDRSSVLGVFDRKYGRRQFDGPGRPRLAMRLIPQLPT